MLVKTWLDGVAISHAILSVLYLLVMMIFVIHARDHPFMAARGSRFIAIMCAAGAVHIVAVTISHQHADLLDMVETQSCVLWGYWLPYMAVGLWFTCQYLQTLTYAALLSRRFSANAAKRVIFSRPFIGAFILIPPIVINAIVTFVPGVTYVVPETTTCASKVWAKLVISGWIATCIIALAITILWFRRSFGRDAVREMPRQGAVLAVSVAAAGTQAFVIVVAGRGLDEVGNRLVATVTIGTMYVLSIAILAHRPLWEIRRKNENYVQIETKKLQTLQQPVRSMMSLMDHTIDEPSPAIRLIFGDFLNWVSKPERPRMDVGNGLVATHPSGLTVLYARCDFYTRTRLGDSYDHKETPYGNRMQGGLPPLLSVDTITRSAQDICKEHFEHPNGEHEGAHSDVGPLHIPRHIEDAIMDQVKGSAAAVPETVFVPLMWWILMQLDLFFGETYLSTVAIRSDLYLDNADVRIALTEVYRKESHARFLHAGVNLAGIPTGTMSDLFSTEDPTDDDTYYEQQPGGIPLEDMSSSDTD